MPPRPKPDSPFSSLGVGGQETPSKFSLSPFDLRSRICRFHVDLGVRSIQDQHYAWTLSSVMKLKVGFGFSP